MLSAKFACAVVARERDAPVIMREREAIADVGHEGPLVDTVAGLKGIAVQRDVVQNPAGVKRNEQMPVPVAASGFSDRRGIFTGWPQRRGTEVIGQAYSVAKLCTRVRVGGEVAQAAAPVVGEVQSPTAGSLLPECASPAFVDQLQHRFVAQLMPPAIEAIYSNDVVPPVLCLSGQGGWPYHANANLRGTKRICKPRVVAETQHQCAGERPVIRYQITARLVGRGVHHLPESDSHVLLVETLGLQHFEKAIQAADKSRKAWVIDIVDQVWRDPTDEKPIGVPPVLTNASEHVVVDPQIERSGRAQRVVARAGLFLRKGIFGRDAQRQQQYGYGAKSLNEVFGLDCRHAAVPTHSGWLVTAADWG